MMIFLSLIPLTTLSFKSFFHMSHFFYLESVNLLLIMVSTLCLLCVFSFMFSQISGTDKFLALICFSSVGVFSGICFLSSKVFLFFFLYEVIIWPMSLALSYFSKEYDKVNALSFMFLTNLMGSAPFMMFFLNLKNYFYPFLNMFYSNSFCTSYLMFMFMSLLFLSKIPVFLLHFWLAKAHVEGSVSCSMILASLLLKLGTFGILKYSFLFLGITLFLFKGIFCLSLMGLILFTFLMIRFADIKILVAVSSLVHMGLIFPMISLMNSVPVFSGVCMMVSHGVISLFLFFLVCSAYESSLSRSMNCGEGLESVNKILTMMIFFFMFMNLGVPPFISFILEVYFMEIFYSLSSFIYPVSFFLVALLSIIFCMFMLSKLSFSKKFNFSYSYSDCNLMMYPSCFFYSIFSFPYLL